ncbi:cuticle protein 18.7-like [Apis florea]|uniref:cuticle protein 18.7-like n=1 Tax=Apis florea TaxID=7463 RepID=UPI000252B633|nr:cuticle protein 18.7-like [Apis florea]XP_012341544.1 cuticle protein 18.7-like [Apis florea]XP_031772166.1 cuticle protein 18.7-like [Apis florea]
MRTIIILATICSAAIAEPGYVRSVIPYSYLEVLDTPEVAQAKAAHLATQAYEAARNTLGYAHVPTLIHVYTPVSGAPLGADGNVIDTPEVAEAKAAHLTAHALETAKNLGLHPYGALAFASLPYAYRFGYGAPIGPDGRVIDTPEVAAAKAAHLAAHEAAKLASDP